ncbi:MAG: sulfite exporter TauE/SafE family protein [Crocinitomicaceae bacterium]|nr:sulfite exporter TauE/SafE family protein [Crocinitomicaceae bacterium]
MEFIIVALTVLFGAGLTFFSGFGLGTLMLPVFSIFFDLPIAVGATATVHLANNVFKFALVSKHIHFATLIRFGLPALIFAFIGSMLLTVFDHSAPLYTFEINGHSFNLTIVKITIGSLMMFFAWFDLDPRFDNLSVKKRHIPLGGVLSGFFGGLSGHQGAFRAAFLAKAGLTKEQFIGTSNAVSLIVDLARLSIYLFGFAAITGQENKFVAAISGAKEILIVAVIFAFIGTYFGKKLVQKTTITKIQRIVGALLLIMGLLLIIGII